MQALLTRSSKFIDLINDLTGRAVAWLTLVMVLVTCTIVVARYIFNIGSIGLQESVMYMHGIVFMLGIAFTLKEKGHVRVDVLNERLPFKVRTIIDMLGHGLFLLPVAIFLFWASLDYVSFSWSVKESSGQPGGLPGVFLVKTLIPLMAILLAMQGISEILKGVISLKSS